MNICVGVVPAPLTLLGDTNGTPECSIVSFESLSYWATIVWIQLLRSGTCSELTPADFPKAFVGNCNTAYQKFSVGKIKKSLKESKKTAPLQFVCSFKLDTM